MISAEDQYAIDEGCCWNYERFYCRGKDRGCRCSCHLEPTAAEPGRAGEEGV